MELRCSRSPFDVPVDDLLRALCRVRFFDQGLLVGSWPMVVYAQTRGLIYALRTNDIDFAVVEAARKGAGASLPKLLAELGYEPLTDYLSGTETFVRDTFEVEFLLHRRGGNAPPAVTLPAWQVAAQPLPFIDILFQRPVTVHVDDYSLRIPSPEALLVHKLIVAQRRTGTDRAAKKEKDLHQCASLAEIASPDEVQRILQEYRMSKVVRNDIVTSCAETGLESAELGLVW